MVARLFGSTIGIDRLFRAHGICGFTMTIALIAHSATSLLAWSEDVGFSDGWRDLTGRQSYMALAVVAAVFIFLVALSSLRSVRRDMDYETWYYIHLLAYVAIAFALPHSLRLGNDFAATPWAYWFWIGLHVVTALVLVVSRWGRALKATLSPWKIVDRQPLSGNTTEIILESPNSLSVKAGQFAFFRPFARGLWWKSHPFSFSLFDNRQAHITVKNRGDSSGDISQLKVGTKVAVTGPFGSLTLDQFETNRRMIFVLGGVGITPARALLEELPNDHVLGDAPLVFLRAHRLDDLTHYEEVEEMVKARRGRIFNLVGSRQLFSNPFSARELSTVIEDVEHRQAFLCGPDSLINAARRGLLDLGMDKRHIHYERSWW